MSRFVLMSVVVACAINSASETWAQCTSAYRNTAATQARVLVLRPKVRILGDGLSNDVREGASEAVQAGFHEALSRAFEDKGYTFRFDTDAMAQWEETPPNDGAIKALQNEYDSLLPTDIYTKPDCKRLTETSLKTNLKKVADNEQFDVVVLARASGEVRTNTGRVAKKATAIIRGAGEASSDKTLYFNIGVVDGGTGLPLYYCQSTAKGDYVDAPDAQFSGPIQKCLKQYFSRWPAHH